jgi:biotin synthase
MESSCEQILKWTEKILNGGEITEDEARALIRTKDEDTMLLLACADKIRQKFSGRSVDLCAIINARSGSCQEDCKFCAQSARYNTGVKTYKFLPEGEVIEAAKRAKKAGAARFDIVTAGRDQRNPKDFAEILDLIRRIRKEVGIEVCCSLGFLTQEQAYQLKEAGISRLHCNIESAPSFFKEVCTTHTAEEKAENVARAQKAGIRVCCGGIIGLGESLDQRVEMAFHLKDMHIDAVPLNVLNPIPGTPFEHNKRLTPLEILRSFAMFRFVLPKAQIRTAGGRQINLRSLQSMALAGGMNGVMIGNYLTSKGSDPHDDIAMLHDLGRTQTAPNLN